MDSHKKRILAFGAHPDDCDLKAGGIANKYTAAGHDVKFVSVTNGEAGHHEISGEKLVERRRKEARQSANVANIEYEILNIPDGELRPTLANRRKIIRLIRHYEPDLILTPRLNDYHPDHRYTSTLIQDSAYMVTVPNICPDTKALSSNPVIGYVSDGFQKPNPFVPDIVMQIDDVIEDKKEMLHQHTSQFYEWLPYAENIINEVPEDEEERKEWMAEKWLSESKRLANEYRDKLIERYGEERGSEVEYAEAFEGCEYGSPLTEENKDTLFPF